MQYRYYLRRLTFAQHMTTLEDLRPIPPNQDLRLTKPQLNQVMRPMMRYINSHELWIQEPSKWLKYKNSIKKFILSTRQLFTHRLLVPQEVERRTVRNSTGSIDITTRVSTDRGLKSLILAYIVVAIMVVVYIEFNIFFRRYEK